MKRLLIPLLAVLALPTAVNAETWWLMAAGRNRKQAGSTSYTWAIPTNSKEECEIAGEKFLNNDWKEILTQAPKGKDSVAYLCVKGK